MVPIKRRGLTPQQTAELENAVATATRNASVIDYIAMMADIEIPTEEEEYSESEI